MVNILNIESYIDKRKLLFFGRLCRLKCSKLAKNVFIERIYHHENNNKSGTGPVEDMCRIIYKYDLSGYLEKFSMDTSFPDKYPWRNIVNQAIFKYEAMTFQATVAQNNRLSRFSDIYGTLCHVHPIWVAETLTTGHRKHFRDLAKLNCVLYGSAGIPACVYCNKPFDDQLEHYMHHCIKYESTRELYWSVVINSFSVYLSRYLHNLSERDLTSVILGKTPDFNSPIDD